MLTMHRADKAVLRLTAGLGLAVLVAYGLALSVPFVVCLMSVLVLCKPGPPLPPIKGLIIAVIFAVLVASGVLMVPILEHYAWSGVILTGAILYVVFFMGLVSANPLTMVLVIAFALIPVVGVADQAIVGGLSMTLATGILIGALVSGVSSALFPDPPLSLANRPVPNSASREAARWIALRATVIVMPVFCIGSHQPIVLSCGDHEDGGVKSAGWRRRCPHCRRRTGWINPDGCADRGCGMAWLVAPPYSLDAGFVDDGRRAMGWQRHLQNAVNVVSSIILEQRADHHADPARPGDRG